MKKILVESDSVNVALDIMLLVDHPKFLEQLAKLRDKWNINPYKKIESLGVPVSNLAELYIDQLVLEHDPRITDQDSADKLLQELQEDIYSLRALMGRTKNYDPLIEQVLFTNTAPESVFKKCYFDVIKTDDEHPDRFEYVIVLSPTAKPEDVQKAFSDFQNYYNEKSKLANSNITFGIDPFIDDYVKSHVFGPSHHDLGKPIKTQKKLFRARELYWKRNEHLLNDSQTPTPYPDVVDWWMGRCPKNNNHDNGEKCEHCDLDIDIAQKAVTSYERLLIRSSNPASTS